MGDERDGQLDEGQPGLVGECAERVDGFRPDYGWLDVPVPVLDAKSQLRREGGVVGSPGLYALGLLPVLRRRKSTLITASGMTRVR